MKRFNGLILIFSLFLMCIALPVFAEKKDLLTAEENLWLKSRNDTIVIYPLENSPPYSYKNSAGNPQGLSIDYLELIAEKIGAKMQYLTARSNSQVQTDFQNGKGDVIPNITPDTDKEKYLIFTDNYVASPAVIVVRKDYEKKSGLNLNDFNGKRVAVVDSSALESYMRINYPRVVVEEVTDNEVGLQQVVLGEVDAAAMDVASLSYYLSKQVLNSVKIVGDTGFESKPSFGIQKNLPILQSILEKGLSQITTTERSILNDKWIVVPTQEKQSESLLTQIQDSFNLTVLYILLGIGIVIVLIIRRRDLPRLYIRKSNNDASDLEEEISELAKSNRMIAEELKDIKDQEHKLEKKIDSLDK